MSGSRARAIVNDDDSQRMYRRVTRELLADEDVDVDFTPDGLLVRGTLFAFLDGTELVVQVPAARASDLLSRGVVSSFTGGGRTSRNWVRVSDLQLWSELAREAHEHVGKPPVGRQS